MRCFVEIDILESGCFEKNMFSTGFHAVDRTGQCSRILKPIFRVALASKGHDLPPLLWAVNTAELESRMSRIHPFFPLGEMQSLQSLGIQSANLAQLKELFILSQPYQEEFREVHFASSPCLGLKTGAENRKVTFFPRVFLQEEYIKIFIAINIAYPMGILTNESCILNNLLGFFEGAPARRTLTIFDFTFELVVENRVWNPVDKSCMSVIVSFYIEMYDTIYSI